MPHRAGRRPAATRAEVVAHAASRLSAGETLDVVAVARATGAGRTSIYRWFGDRTGLLSEALWLLTDRLWMDARRRTPGRGPGHATAVFRRFLEDVNAAPLSAALLRDEPRTAVLALMARDGHMQRRAVERLRDLLEEHTDLSPTTAGQTATVLTPLAMSFVFAGALGGRGPDIDAVVLICRRLIDDEASHGVEPLGG